MKKSVFCARRGAIRAKSTTGYEQLSLTLNQQEETFWVFLQDSDGLFCGLNNRRINAWIPVHLITQIPGFKQSCEDTQTTSELCISSLRWEQAQWQGSNHHYYFKQSWTFLCFW